jgi:hypothetical protein
MPGGAGGELLALDQDNIAPALLGQVIKRRNANHAATDNNHPRLRFHGNSFRPGNSILVTIVREIQQT